jgi:lipoic acid synthetase
MINFQKKHISLADVHKLQKKLKKASLNTVCENARCPNIGECFHRGVVTLLIGGDVCTRGCGFCAITKGTPQPLDAEEPVRVARMVKILNLKYAVITSVTRDDLFDGGADHYFKTVKTLRALSPQTIIEILVPDFLGRMESVQKAISSQPDVFSHNLETVPRLYKEARSGADYQRSLDLLKQAKQAGLTTKSGLMLGLGENDTEVLEVMSDLITVGCDILTLGQYLAPTKKHLPVQRYLSEQQFESFRQKAVKIGFRSCASAPYVRSSYLADTMI